MKAYLPIVWNFGENPNDGYRGPAVDDPLAIYIDLEEDESIGPLAEFDSVVLKTSVSALINEVVEGSLDEDKKTVIGIHGEICRKIHHALILEAHKIETVLPQTEEEPWITIMPSFLIDDRDGNIAGTKSGQVMLNIAYIFGLAEMPEIASFIIQYGKSLGLEALNNT
jgi:hypothetical protein